MPRQWQPMPTKDHKRVCFPRCIDPKKVADQEIAYLRGYGAHGRRKFADSNPHEESTPLWHCWYEGWLDADNEHPFE